MANLYYNAAVDATWDELGNWWNDAVFSDPALALPADGDDVYLGAGMDSGPSVSVTLNHIYVADASTGGGYINVNFTGADGNATFYDSSYNYGGTVTGNATFNGTSYNYFGLVSGNATFNDSSSNGFGSTVAGNATFNDYSYNSFDSTVAGDATFNDYSNNYATVSGDATFNNSSYNYNGTVSGNATFNDNSRNGPDGIVSGNATFRNSSRNYGFIQGDAVVYYDDGEGRKPMGGSANGTVTYIDFPTVYGVYFNAAVDTAWDTLGNWWNDVAFTIPATYLPPDGGTVYLAAQMTSGPSTSVTLNHIYVADASTGGGGFYVIFTGADGNATFNDNSGNSGTVAGDATFNDNSLNCFGGSTVAGDATFRNTSCNAGTIAGNATFYGSSSNGDNGTVSGDATFNDNSLNYSGSTIAGNATFNDYSYNNGTVSGDVTFDLTAAATQIKGGYGGSFNGDVFVSVGSGGGSDNTIARLLNLPWFINL